MKSAPFFEATGVWITFIVVLYSNKIRLFIFLNKSVLLKIEFLFCRVTIVKPCAMQCGFRNVQIFYKKFDANFVPRTPVPVGISMSFLTNTGKLAQSLTRLVCQPTCSYSRGLWELVHLPISTGVAPKCKK